ncbi:DNA damage-inducible protein 1-like [Cucumis melo var. makuwa]|uniref:DNA damage-inducible protein 1-like n=1 Tax=Cucumis melo var. makuwa TaxID=1194695 RepID=A0A5A7T3H7_CUCMM|nr:DNA damage-inducible protein 1-like [Cucumis melo var. makuwa]TYK30444.1 DNA damage-inducible protein 1-like [Cucumis melo var. makuwa]
MKNIGWAQDVKTRVGGWQGKLDFLIAPLDDCKIVLGLDFIDTAHATINFMKKTLDFTHIREEAPLKRMGATGEVRLSAMRVRRRHKGKGSRKSKNATRTLRIGVGEGVTYLEKHPKIYAGTCHKAPIAKPRGSLACPHNTPMRPCDSPHRPPTHAHDMGVCPRKAAHEPRMQIKTCAHDSPMRRATRTTHGHQQMHISARHQRYPGSSCAQAAAHGIAASPACTHTHQTAAQARIGMALSLLLVDPGVNIQ